MSDLINRQDAVDAINELHDKPNAWLDLAVEALEKLPSAQPEIIRCKDCKFYHKEWDGTESHYYEDYWCEWVEPKEDDFCSLAERRTDE